jgi:Domain of unknown function (DUF4398)
MLAATLRETRMRKLTRLTTLAAASLLCLACASFPPPTARMSDAEAAIRGADEVDANAVPRAQLHLKLAQEQVDKAKRFMQEEQHDRADLALRRAEADAELAIALAREKDMTTKAKAARAKVEKLRAAHGI